jgi:broad-specificity NMP kinase
MMKRDKRSTSKPKKKEAVEPEMVKEISKSTDFINSMIHEYLLRKDFIKSLDTFQEELNDKIKQKKYSNVKFNENNIETLLDTYFTTGKKNEFFKIWNRVIPSHIKLRDSSLEKVEFFLQIYFAVFPLLPHVVDKKVYRNLF